MTDIAIEVKNLNKSFGTKEVLKGLSLKVEKGKSMVIIGGSGSGKSVLIKTIIGILTYDSGQILLNGREIRPEDKSKFGVLFQGGALFDSLPVWHNVSFGAIQKLKLREHAAKELAERKLKSVGLSREVMDLYPVELSGGMQKRVALARAIALDPEFIFFDEPTSGLDPIMSDVINNLIVECSKELGATTITISHDMNSVKKIADSVAMVYNKSIIWSGKKEEIFSSDNPYLDQFVNGKAEGPIKTNV
jgi:phospholipid/cholesterol/gamma-HCH transport system ATP-binding protein